MTQLVWIMRGTAAGQFVRMDDDDAERAEQEGWGEIAIYPKRDANSFSRADKSPHPQSDAFMNRRLGGYDNRQLEAAPSPSPQVTPLATRPDGEAGATLRTPEAGKPVSSKGPKRKPVAKTA